MFKKQLPISLVALLLSLTTGDTYARFLQPSTNSSTTTIPSGPMVISTRQALPNITYRSDLSCGECVVGNYIFCINGPENFTGPIVPRTFCCQNSTNCAQARNSSWTCSSKYQNRTLVEKLRVCPFDQNQCGSQQIIIEDQTESQCLRLRTLKKGTACLYKVRSKCQVPSFTHNDTVTNIITDTLMISNTTISDALPIGQPACTTVKNQQCICRTFRDFAANSAGITKLSCDCDTVRNSTYDLTDCQCTIMTDAQGNQIRQCNCPVSVPIQSYLNQECSCWSRFTDPISRRTVLNCTGCGNSTATRNVTLDNSTCKCVTSLNGTRSYFSCACADVPQCRDPESFPIPQAPIVSPAPCRIPYPSTCANSRNDTGLVCNTTNPSTGLSQTITFNTSSLCSCRPVYNVRGNSWYQDCNCCLPDEFVRTRLIPPNQCQNNTMKQNCACSNVTIGNSTQNTRLTCDCIHPRSNVTVGGLVFASRGSQCDCDNINLGNKSCSCCVSYEVQAQQLQPICAVNTSSQSCQCNGNGTFNNRFNCTCLNPRNNLQFSGLSPNATSCYCHPAQFGARACNCCLSENQFQQVRPVCGFNREPTQCRCESSTNGLNCSCTNRYFNNQITSGILYNNQSCACYPIPGSNSSNCTCCSSRDEVIPTSTCNDYEYRVGCKACRFNATSRQVNCNCDGNHYLDSSNSASLQSVVSPFEKCTCQDQSNCDCCLPRNIWATAKLSCRSNSTQQERCNCQNITRVVQEQRVDIIQQTSMRNVTCRRTGCSGEICSMNDQVSSCAWRDSLSCYSSAVCTFNATTQQCGWVNTTTLTNCLRNPPSFQNPRNFQNLTTQRPVNTTIAPVIENVTVFSTVNVNRTSFNCNCSNSRLSRLPLNNAPVTPSNCGCDTFNTLNQSCSCCVDRPFVDELILSTNLTCGNNTSQADCQCQVNAAGRNTSCTCTQRRFNSSAPMTFRGITVDTSRCNCLQANNSQTQNCRCCIPPQQALVPAGPSCSLVNNGTGRSCECVDEVNPFTGRTNLRCRCMIPPAPVQPAVTPVLNTTTTNTTRPANATNATSNATTNATSTNGTRPANVTTNTTIRNTTNATTNSTRPANSTNSTGNTTVRVVENQPTFFEILLAPSQCNCLSYFNGTHEVKQCNCCIQNTLSCQGNNTAQTQNCSCQGIIQGNFRRWNCSCLRTDNNIVAQFQFDRQQCSCNEATNECRCCINRVQFDQQVPVLTCDAQDQRQRCLCSGNSTSIRGPRDCSCIRNDNGVQGKFSFGQNQCLCQDINSTNCTCCVSPQRVETQIPRKQCITEGPNFTAQYCSCRNFTNATRNTPLNCSCQRPDFQLPRSFNISQSACLCLNSTRCECCLDPTQQAAMIPRLQCNSNDLAQTGCQQSNNSQFTCNIQYQNTTYTLRNLNSFRDQCMCNTTTCGCCINQRQIEDVTERQCNLNQFRSVCDSCTRFNRSAGAFQFNCTGCDNFYPEFTIANQSSFSLNAAQCLCRNLPSGNSTVATNCTCCLNNRPAAPQATCRSGSELFNNTCQCAPRFIMISNTTLQNVTSLQNVTVTTTVNGRRVNTTQLQNVTSLQNVTTWRNVATNQHNCDCVRAANFTNQFTESYFRALPINQANCSCINVTRPNGVQNLQCSCCAEPGLLIAEQPVCPGNDSLSQCRCSNSSGKYGCDCPYKNTNVIVRGIDFQGGLCSCPSNNATVKTCGCCVKEQQYRDFITPTCQGTDPLSTCRCAQVGGQLRCNCSGDLRTTGQTVQNNDLVLSQTQCGCYNESNGLTCKCCLREQILTAPNARQCTTDRVQANCTLSNSSVGYTCQARSGSSVTFTDATQLNSSDCTCANLTQRNRTVQQCSCCIPRTLITPRQPAVCNLNTSQILGCDCRQNRFDELVCDCRRPNQIQTLATDPAQCSCLNQTLGNSSNSLNCSCCVANPPLPLCQQLQSGNSSVLGCRCNDIVVNGKIVFSCDCTHRVNATHNITRQKMLVNENSCCCVERTDPVTRRGFKSCNCTQPAVPQNQKCSCRQVANSTQVQCNCTDCNNRIESRVHSPNRCQCQGLNTGTIRVVNTTNSTSNTTSSNATRTNTTNSSTNVTTNTTRVNTTSNVTNNSSSTTNGTRTNTTSANTTTNATNGTRNNVTNTTSSTNTTNSTRTNVTNSTSAANTTNSTRTNVTNTTSTTNISNSTRPNVTNTTTGPVTPSQPDVFSCSCQVDFQGFCPSVPQNAPLNEDTCDALNRPSTTVPVIKSNCTQQYEYLVAVVATSRDSSVLLQLQQYQMQYGQFIKASLASLLLIATSLFFF